MENKDERRTEAWFQSRDFTADVPFKSGPGAYRFEDYKPKQSWNKGQVPFGSNAMLENGTIFSI